MKKVGSEMLAGVERGPFGTMKDTLKTISGVGSSQHLP
jgi:hypothetical protein